ncbi:MAG: Holliday junction branch migration protein RuvA [Sandaracinaceae bacterium]
MIGRLRGSIIDRQLDGSCILDVGGVGYEVFVPLGSLGRMADAPETVTLFVHTHVREDAFMLYGFATAEDRLAFRTLLGISSIGPKSALAILGAMDARALASAIASQDKTRFKGIPGVGKRTTERLLLELRDKLGFVNASMVSAPAAAPARVPVASGPLGTVAGILTSMGFKPAQAERAIALIGEDVSDDDTVEDLVKLALTHLG